MDDDTPVEEARDTTPIRVVVERGFPHERAMLSCGDVLLLPRWRVDALIASGHIRLDTGSRVDPDLSARLGRFRRPLTLGRDGP